MNRDEIYSYIESILHDEFEIEKDRINPQANLYTDLEIDSIDAVDLLVYLTLGSPIMVVIMVSLPSITGYCK